MRRDTDAFAPPPGDRPHIAVVETVLQAGVELGLVDLRRRERDLHVHDLRRVEQPLGVGHALEDLAAVHPLALEDGGGVVQAMGQYVHLRLAPGRKLAVQPNPTVAIIEGN